MFVRPCLGITSLVDIFSCRVSVQCLEVPSDWRGCCAFFFPVDVVPVAIIKPLCTSPVKLGNFMVLRLMVSKELCLFFYSDAALVSQCQHRCPRVINQTNHAHSLLPDSTILKHTLILLSIRHCFYWLSNLWINRLK